MHTSAMMGFLRCTPNGRSLSVEWRSDRMASAANGAGEGGGEDKPRVAGMVPAQPPLFFTLQGGVESAVFSPPCRSARSGEERGPPRRPHTPRPLPSADAVKALSFCQCRPLSREVPPPHALLRAPWANSAGQSRHTRGRPVAWHSHLPADACTESFTLVASVGIFLAVKLYMESTFVHRVSTSTPRSREARSIPIHRWGWARGGGGWVGGLAGAFAGVAGDSIDGGGEDWGGRPAPPQPPLPASATTAAAPSRWTVRGPATGVPPATA